MCACVHLCVHMRAFVCARVRVCVCTCALAHLPSWTLSFSYFFFCDWHVFLKWNSVVTLGLKSTEVQFCPLPCASHFFLAPSSSTFHLPFSIHILPSPPSLCHCVLVPLGWYNKVPDTEWVKQFLTILESRSASSRCCRVDFSRVG